MSKGTLLIVEDEEIVAADLAQKLGRLGYQISGATGRGEDMEMDDEDYDEDDTTSVMTLANRADCIGCGACGRVCPKGCYSYAALPPLAA